MDYRQAAERLGTRDSRKMGNNTYLKRRDERTIALKLHETDVLTYTPDGVTYNTGGWQTTTTKSRLNEYGRDGYKVWSDKGQWKLFGPVWYGQKPDPVVIYEDGLTIHTDGTITGAKTPEEAKADAKFRKDAGAYAKAYVDKLYAGEIDAPSGGDCFGCQFSRDANTGKLVNPMGWGHLESHMTEDERYYVPSLVWNAMEASGASQYARETVQRLQTGDSHVRRDNRDFIAEQIEKSIKNYLVRERGLGTYKGADRGAARAF